MGSLWVPQVLLFVSAGHCTGVVDEVDHVEDCLGSSLLVAIQLCCGAGHNADVTFFCKVTVYIQISLPINAFVAEFRVVGEEVA
jgi:hypothetical protein